MPVGAYLSSSAAKEASKAMAAAIDRATNEAKRQFDVTTADFAPYKSIGTNAISDYEKMLHGGYDMQESPAAQYQLTQSTKALNRAMAARGLSGSGNAINRLTELNSSIAATDWQNQYNRLLDALNVGTSAAARTASAGSQYVNTLSNAATQIGNNEWNKAQAMNSIYSNLANSAANFGALGTKAGWWGGGAETGLTADGSTMVGWENF